MEEKGPFLLKAIFFAKFQESAWNWIRFVPSYRNYTFITAINGKVSCDAVNLDFSISLHLATLNASSVAPELIESWQKLASLVLTIL